jgi:FAD/FMN-containing dehydrogenase
MPAFKVDPASAQATCAPPPGFPAGIELYQQAFENWAKTIEVEDLWTCAPRTGRQVAEIANWARHHGYRIRPRGSMHGWSPLTVESNATCSDRVVLVDTKPHLNRLELLSSHPPVVRVGPGAEMEALLGFLEGHGLGLTPVPSVGAPTVGGLLAIGAHGATLPGRGEKRPAGTSYASLSNLVVSLRAVVWDRHRRRYVVRTFHRDDPHCHALPSSTWAARS